MLLFHVLVVVMDTLSGKIITLSQRVGAVFLNLRDHVVIFHHNLLYRFIINGKVHVIFAVYLI